MSILCDRLVFIMQITGKTWWNVFSYEILDERGSVLEKMNQNKKGRKFIYPDAFILAIYYHRIYFRLPFIQTERIIKTAWKNLPSHLCHRHICKRANRSSGSINSSSRSIDNNDLIIKVDNTGIKITNRGQGMSDKWDT